MSGARVLHSFGNYYFIKPALLNNFIVTIINKLKNITIYNKLKIITLKKVRQSLTRIILRIDPRLG